MSISLFLAKLLETILKLFNHAFQTKNTLSFHTIYFFTGANGEMEVKLKKDLNFATFITIKPTAIRRKRNCEKERMSELDMQMHNLKIILRCTNATLIRSYASSKFACSYCHDEFTDPLKLKRHNLKSHSFDQERPDVLNIRSLSRYIVYMDITDLRCKVCNIDIDNVALVFKHLSETHNENVKQGLNNHILGFKFYIVNVYKCTECDYKVNDFTDMQMHMNQHFKNYLCEICEEGFVNRAMMVDHKMEVHDVIDKVKKCVAKRQKKVR